MLHHETYSVAGEADALAEYDERLGAFYQREGMKASGWSEQSAGCGASRACTDAKSLSESLSEWGSVYTKATLATAVHASRILRNNCTSVSTPIYTHFQWSLTIR